MSWTTLPELPPVECSFSKKWKLQVQHELASLVPSHCNCFVRPWRFLWDLGMGQYILDHLYGVSWCQCTAYHSIDSVYWLLFYIYTRCLEKMFHCLHCWQVNKSQYKLRFAVRRLTGYPWGHSQVTLRPLQPFSPTGIAMELCTCSKQLET
jgi:hypothetical protein